MKVTVKPSTGTSILVWREDDAFFARRTDQVVEPQICLAVDLFEVIAELAGLRLEVGPEALEAIKLADDARRRLHTRSGDVPQDDDDDFWVEVPRG